MSVFSLEWILHGALCEGNSHTKKTRSAQGRNISISQHAPLYLEIGRTFVQHSSHNDRYASGKSGTS